MTRGRRSALVAEAERLTAAEAEEQVAGDHRGLPRATLAWVALETVAATAAASWTLRHLEVPPASAWVLLTVAVAVGAVLVALPVSATFRRDLVSVDIEEAVPACLLLLVPAPLVVVTHALGWGAGWLLHERQVATVEHRIVKRLHNFDNNVLTSSAMVGVFGLLTGPGSTVAHRALAVVVGGLVGTTLNGITTSVAAGLTNHDRIGRFFVASVPSQLAAGLVATGLGAMAGAVAVASGDTRLIALLLAPLAMMLASSRSHIRAAAARDHLAEFLDATGRILDAGDVVEAETLLTDAAQSTFRARAAALAGGAGTSPTSLSVPVGRDGRWLVVEPGGPTTPYPLPREQLLRTLGAVGGAAVENLRLRQTLARQARFDPLTGLANRRELHDWLRRLEASSDPFAVVAVDVNRLKPVNDTLGHDAGDVLIRAVGARLASAVRQTDGVARVGGDEFVVVLAGSDPAVAAAVMEEVAAGVGAPLDVAPGHRIAPSISWGIASAPRDGTDADELLSLADARMYARKRAQRHTAAS